MITEKQVHDCLKIIIIHQDEKSLNYCINYAKAGLCLSGHDLRVQILYILNNMICWRGDTAKAIRLTLKQFIKKINQEEKV